MLTLRSVLAAPISPDSAACIYARRLFGLFSLDSPACVRPSLQGAAFDESFFSTCHETFSSRLQCLDTGERFDAGFLPDWMSQYVSEINELT